MDDWHEGVVLLDVPPGDDGEWQHATPCPEWTVLGLCCHQAIRKVQSTEHAVESM